MGYDHYSKKDAFNPLNWFNFALGYILEKICPRFVAEQYILRFYDDYCRENCYESVNGKCVHCGCDANQKVLVPSSQCSKGHWGRIIWNKEEYRKHREEYPVKIEIKYGR